MVIKHNDSMKQPTEAWSNESTEKLKDKLFEVLNNKSDSNEGTKQLKCDLEHQRNNLIEKWAKELRYTQPPSQGHTSTARWPCYSALRISSGTQNLVYRDPHLTLKLCQVREFLAPMRDKFI